MVDEPTPLEGSPHAQLHNFEQRLHTMGLLSQTTLCGLLVLVMGADLVLLRNPSSYVPLTAAQTMCLGLSSWVAWRRAMRGALDAPRHMSRTTAYFSATWALATIALVEKWWIALRPDLIVRLSYASSYRIMSAALTLAGVFLLLSGGKRLVRYFAAFAEQPARLTALSFLGLAVFGAFLLSLPISVREPAHVSFIDALFMATSAACVTGLAVHGIANEYTIWGQIVLLGLVQVGGMGIMVLSASMLVLTGRKLRVRSSAVLAEMLDAESVASLRGSIRGIVLFTLAIEAVGAILLYPAFATHAALASDATDRDPLARTVAVSWSALFHAVSAFCNAGFTLSHDSLVPFARSYDVCSIVMCLIILGGLGFPVLSELSRYAVQRTRGQRPPRISLHTRTVLVLTATLIPAVALMLAVVEWNGALGAQPAFPRLFAALFQSVTLRTAGFNTVDFGAFSHAGLLICMLFMFVGASSGGTGGGVKVTTFAVLFAKLRAELRGDTEATLFDRRLPPTTVRRAISVAFVAVVVLTFVVLSLLLTERHEPLRIAFEAVSAFATVGLSTNLTPELTISGKLIIIVTMLIGRVGPLTVALAASNRGQRPHYSPPQERVLIG